MLLGSGLLWLPYLLQLLCIIHILKTHQNTYWIWIIIMLPYIGGLAYLVIEVIPHMSSRRSMSSIQDSVVYFIKPSAKIETLRQKAEFSPTHNNLIDYADALLSTGAYAKALDIYNAQKKGLFKDDLELSYKIAYAEFKSGQFAVAKDHIEKMMDPKTKLFKQSKQSLLYLATIENTDACETVKAEYKRILSAMQDSAIELHYLQYLTKNEQYDEVINKIAVMRKEEDAMKKNHMRYNRSFYTAAYRLEREIHERRKEKGEM